MKSLCVFCGSSSGVRKEYVQLAQQLGNTLAEQRVAVVYGGGRVGLMGAVETHAITELTKDVER